MYRENNSNKPNFQDAQRRVSKARPRANLNLIAPENAHPLGTYPPGYSLGPLDMNFSPPPYDDGPRHDNAQHKETKDQYAHRLRTARVSMQIESKPEWPKPARLRDENGREESYHIWKNRVDSSRAQRNRNEVKKCQLPVLRHRYSDHWHLQTGIYLS